MHGHFSEHNLGRPPPRSDQAASPGAQLLRQHPTPNSLALDGAGVLAADRDAVEGTDLRMIGTVLAAHMGHEEAGTQHAGRLLADWMVSS